MGPALGGWLFAVAALLPFAVNGGTLAVAAVLALTLPDLFRAPPVLVGVQRSGLGADVAEGVRWLARHRLLRLVTALVFLLALLDAAWFAILVLYVEQVAGVTAAGFGLLLAVGALGGVAGGLLADRIIGRLSLTDALAMGVMLTGVAQLVLGLTSAVSVIAASLAASGFAFAVANVVVVSLRQRATPSRLLGRVTATYRTLVMGGAALGALLGGAAASAFGLRAPMLAGAPLLIGAGIAAVPLLGQHRRVA